MPITIAFANHKGGTGKTSVTVQTAAALARAGKRVLVVDMDPQANATRRLGIEHRPGEEFLTVGTAILFNTNDQPGGIGIGEQAVRPCGWTDGDGEPTAEAALIEVLPSDRDLANREWEASIPGAVERLSLALAGWTPGADGIQFRRLHHPSDRAGL
jgi:chromosome partitioning protein